MLPRMVRVRGDHVGELAEDRIAKSGDRSAVQRGARLFRDRCGGARISVEHQVVFGIERSNGTRIQNGAFGGRRKGSTSEELRAAPPAPGGGSGGGGRASLFA